ncbi:MAG: cytosine permease [Christensenella sp.]|nr:cytosine permease [Christensenella sp.]
MAMEKKAMAPIGKNERQGWPSIAFIWIGIVICVPVLMVGGMLGQGLDFGSLVWVTLIGWGIVGAVMCLTGIMGSDLGLPSEMTSTKSFGNTGARIIVAMLGAISAIGWFAIQSFTCGAAFVLLLKNSFGVDFPLWLSIIIWSAVMVSSAIYGIKFLTILNYVAVPALIALCVFVLVTILSSPGAGTEVLNYTPAQPIPFISAVSTMIGCLAAGMVISADYSRYAKNRSATVKATVIGVLPAALIICITGAVAAIVTGKTDITEVFASLGFPVLAMIVLILATWTTNTGNAYIAGLGIMKTFNIKDSKRPLITLVLGIIATVVSLLLISEGVSAGMTTFLGFISIAVPPVAGVMIADYWIVGRGKVKNWHVVKGVNWIGVLAWAIPVVYLFAGGPNFLNAAIDSVVISMVAYLLLYLAFGKTKLAGGGAISINDVVNMDAMERAQETKIEDEEGIY